MEESIRGQEIRNDRISPAAPPRFHRRVVSTGFDHSGFSASSLRAYGRAFAGQRMRLHMRGHYEGESSVPRAVGSESDLAEFPREHKAIEFFPAWMSGLSPCTSGFECVLSAATGRLLASSVHSWVTLP